MALKIAHIVRQFSPSIGGLETAVLNLAQKQRETLGIDAYVVTLERVFGLNAKLPAQDEVAGVPVVRLPWWGSTRYPLAPSVLLHLGAADILHVHAIDFFFDFLALTQPIHRRAMVASTHGGFFHTGRFARIKRLWFNTVTRASIRAYGRIIACSQSDAALFRHHAAGRLITIENGIDREKFRGAAAQTQTRTIIYFGRFAENKRLSSLFPILAALQEKHPDWRLIVAGREGEIKAEQILEMARHAGVATAVSCVAEPSDEQLRRLIGEASFFICLSSYEGFGMAAVEAMSAGLLPILSDIPPFRRLCEETDFGLVATLDDPHGTAEMMEANILDETAYRIRRASVQDAVRQYDWNNVAKQYSDACHEVLAQK